MMKKTTVEYKNFIKEAAYAVDRENSTHFNADTKAVKIIERILKYSPNELYKKICNNDLSIIDEISKKTSKEPKSRSNFSFATKFCHYYSYYIFEVEAQDNYSIFDSIVRKALPKYIKMYKIKINEIENVKVLIGNLNKDIENKKSDENFTWRQKNNLIKVINNNESEKLLDFVDNKKISNEDKYSFSKRYEIYRDIINEVICLSKAKISRNGFDHLLWYYYKAR